MELKKRAKVLCSLTFFINCSNCSMKELEKDMTLLRSGMKECGREVEFYRGQPVTNGDRYLPVMKEFMTMASVRVAELEDLFVDMKARVI